MYFRDQGDSLTKAVMVNKQQPTERRGEPDNEEYSVGEGVRSKSSAMMDKLDPIC